MTRNVLFSPIEPLTPKTEIGPLNPKQEESQKRSMAKKGRGEAEEDSGGAVPEAAIDSVKRSLANMDQLMLQLQDLLSISSDPQVFNALPALHRAQALFLLSKAASTLVSLRLRCTGVQPDEHPVKKEMERISLYQEKFDRSMALNRAPLRPSTTLNSKAATRFIEHSLPDLTSEQRQSMRNISRGETVTRRDNWSGQKKRKTENKSVRASAQEFLEKASHELLGANKGDMKGPLKFESSDGED